MAVSGERTERVHDLQADRVGENQSASEVRSTGDDVRRARQSGFRIASQ